MSRTLACRTLLAAALTLPAAPGPLRAAQAPSQPTQASQEQDRVPAPSATSAAEALVERERVRSAVVAAMELYQRSAPDGTHQIQNFNDAVEQVAEIGAPAVPLLEVELDQGLPETFRFCAYALGRIPTPESERALRRAMRRANKDSIGDWPEVRKAWAGWALSLHGVTEVIDLFDQGERRSAHVPMHADTSALEAAAIQLGSDAVPLLLGQLDRYVPDDEMMPMRMWTLRALRRTPDPRSVPALAKLVDDGSRPVRFEAARALGAIPTAESVSALAGALGDEEILVRRAGALSLERIQSPRSLEPMIAHLASETDAVTRSALYRAIAGVGGADAAETLRDQRGKLDPDDRRGLVEAMGWLPDRLGADFLRGAVADRDTRVALEAVLQLARIGGARALDAVMVAVRDERWPVAQTAVEELTWLEHQPAGPRLAGRLVGRELRGVVTDPRARTRIEKLGEGLAVLGYHEPAADIRKAAGRQSDARLVRYLEDLADRLDMMETHGNDVERWTAALASDTHDQRETAYRALGRIGGTRAARALAEALQATDDARDQIAIVRALGRVNHRAAEQALRHVLLDPAYDPPDRWPVRDMAAWSARRLGGEAMRDALRDSAMRRHGRDADVLVYLALVDPEGTLPLLRELRPQRMAYLKWLRGKEQETLDRIAEAIAAGRTLEPWDRPPERLEFR